MNKKRTMLELEAASIKPKFQKESKASLLYPVIIIKYKVYISMFLMFMSII
ncbi:glucose-inhibited division protein A [Marinomonas sp. MED121]|nr:glucose-inhibited division protein A [Marinomonas sp. MED121]